MKIEWIPVVIFTLIGSSALAADGETIHVKNLPTYVVPAHSPVAFSSLGEFTTVRFSGRFRVDGEYHIGNIEDQSNPGEYEVSLALYFVPDKKYGNRLPYWKNSGHVKELWFANRDDFIAAAIPPDVVENVKHTAGAHASGRASLIVEDYQASVECDYPEYVVRFVSISKRERAQIASGPWDQRGC